MKISQNQNEIIPIQKNLDLSNACARKVQQSSGSVFDAILSYLFSPITAIVEELCSSHMDCDKIGEDFFSPSLIGGINDLKTATTVGPTPNS